MLKSFVLAALAAVAAVSAQLTISTPPSLVQCQPVLISWSGGTGPYILTVIPGGQTGAAALTTISNSASGNSITWTCDIASGTSVTLQIVDAMGTRQYSSPLTIQSSSDSSCLNGASASGGSSAAGSASGSASMASSGAASGSASATSMMMSSSTAASSAASTSRASSATSMSGSMTSSASAAAASTSGAAYKRYEVPAAILAAVGGVAALF